MALSSSIPAFAIYSGVGKLPAVLALTVVGGDTGKDAFCLDAGRGFGDCGLAGCTEGGGVMLLEGGGGEAKVDRLCTLRPRVGDCAPREDIGGGVDGTHISAAEESCASGS
jgi:hypothetical protein